MFATLTLALLPQLAQELPLAPYGLPLGSASAQAHSLPGPAVIEDFEAYAISPSAAENIGSLYLDEFVITGTGQGPGLVASGAGYAATAGSLQWNGDGYFGLATRTFLSNSGDGLLTIRYASPQSSVTVNLHAFSGYGDTAEVVAYTSTGTFVDSSGPLAVPDPTPVPATVSGTGIGYIEIRGTYSWSPIIDLHDYDGGGSGTLQLSIVGPCPGLNTVTINGGIPGNVCRVLYAFGTGSFTIPSGPCAGTVLGLDSSVSIYNGPFTFDASGQVIFSASIPAAACGSVWVQAIEVGTCNTSNVVPL